jgi:hypothetical protein
MGMTTANIDPKKCWRQKVTAEITTTHVEQIARESQVPLAGMDATQFLNEQGRAYELWKVMMHAAEEYIKDQLCQNGARPGYTRAWAAVHSR